MESHQPDDQMAPPVVDEKLVYARVLLRRPDKRDPAWPALAATGFFAVCAMTFAITAIMTPARDYAPVPAHKAP